ncbi:GNAT family N-acetyltransferase [soil metagenome]
MHFERLDPFDDDAQRDWYAVSAAVVAADQPDDPLPCPVDHAGRLRYPFPGEDEEVWLARAAGVVVGSLRVQWPRFDNLDTAGAAIAVVPAHRGRGYGRQLGATLLDLVRAEGRHRVMAEVHELLSGEPTPGARFAAAMGARRALLETGRRLRLAEVEEATYDALMADAERHAAGYTLLQWLGPTPEAHLADMAELSARMSTDAPMEDLDWEPEVFDADRVRGRDAACAARGMRRYTTAVRHEQSGALVGFTTLICFATIDWYADQWETIVAPEHRGHRLGTLIKVANLRWTREHEPALTVVDTWNAESNRPMVAVNEAMGFRPLDRWVEWQLEL